MQFKKRRNLQLQRTRNLLEFGELVASYYEDCQKNRGNFYTLLMKVSKKIKDQSTRNAFLEDLIENQSNQDNSKNNWDRFLAVFGDKNDPADTTVFLAQRMMDNIDLAIEGNPDFKNFDNLFTLVNNEYMKKVDKIKHSKEKEISKYPKYIKCLVKVFTHMF